MAALAAVCNAVRQMLPCDRAQVWRGDVHQMTMYTLTSSGYSDDDAIRLATLKPPMAAMPLEGDLIAAKYLEVRDTSVVTGLGPLLFQSFGIQQVVFLLLERADRVLGALQLSWCSSPARFPDRATREVIRRFVGLALDIHARTDEAIELSQTLSQMAMILGSIHDPDELLRAMARKSAEAVGCDWSAVHLIDETSGRMLCAAGFGLVDELAVIEHFVVEPALAEKVLAAADDAIIEVPDAHGVGEPRLYDENAPVASYVSLPLRIESQLSGLLTLGYRQRTGRFSRRQITLAKGLANHAVVALCNAHLVRSLEEANQFKADFLAAVSHDLRTPLHVLIGYNEMLLEGEGGELNDAQRRLLGRMRECSVRFLDLIDGILHIGRMDAGRDSLSLAPVSLAQVCGDLVREVEELRQEGVELRWHATDIPVLADAGKIKTILRNLVTNALKFTEKGNVEIVARVEEPEVVVLEVRDTGPGIGAGERLKIFDMFQQGDAGRRAGGSGLGLGLYLVKRLVEVLGGRIEISAAELGNTVFRVELPISSIPR
jgi:signal transduction histidine kinase